MAVDTSPQPFSNVVMGTAEHLGVAGILAFAMFHPEAAGVVAGVIAAFVAGVLLLAGLLTLWFPVPRIRRFLRRRAQRRGERRLARWTGPPPPGRPPPSVGGRGRGPAVGGGRYSP